MLRNDLFLEKYGRGGGLKTKFEYILKFYLNCCINFPRLAFVTYHLHLFPRLRIQSFSPPPTSHLRYLIKLSTSFVFSYLTLFPAFHVSVFFTSLLYFCLTLPYYLRSFSSTQLDSDPPSNKQAFVCLRGFIELMLNV